MIHKWVRVFGLVARAAIVTAVVLGTAVDAADKNVDGSVQTIHTNHGADIVTLVRDGTTITTVRRAYRKPLTTSQSHIGLGPLGNGDFTDTEPLHGWSVSESNGAATPGTATQVSEKAVLAEGDSFLVTLRQTFLIPTGGALSLSFDLIVEPGFDLSIDGIPDAFEASLLDASNLPVVTPWDALATSYFNMQEDGTVNTGASTTWDGLTATVDLTAVPGGTEVTLFFDLIGADEDTGSGLTIDNVVIAGLNEPPFCDAGESYVAECNGADTTVTLDASASFDPDEGDTITYAWATDCPGTFDDATLEAPTLTLDAGCPDLVECSVTLTVTDDAGASAECIAAVTVQDTTIPDITCPGDTTVECDGLGNVADFDAWAETTAATDACGSVALAEPAITLTAACGSTSATGAEWAATDDCGLSNSCTSTFTVEDTTPPSLVIDTTPIEIVDTDCSGDATVALPVAFATDVCGAASVSDDAPAFFPAGVTTTVNYTAVDDCGNDSTESVDVTVLYGADIDVSAALHTVGSGSFPGSSKAPLVGIDVCAFDKTDGSCARVTCGGISHREYECIATTCEPAGCCTTDAAGECLINVPPGNYIVVSNDATKTVLQDPLGVSVGDVACGEVKTKHLQQILKADGKKVPGKTTRLTGSELLIIEPEYVVWDDTEQVYPFVFETIGDWDVTVAVSPPDGFTADQVSLSEDVNNELEAVQFTIIEVGSDIVPTGTSFLTVHDGKTETVESNVDIFLTSDYARSQGQNVPALRALGLIKDPPSSQVIGEGAPVCGAIGAGCGPIGPAMIFTMFGLFGFRLLNSRRQV